MGNCGVGIAPCRPEAREVAIRDLVNVEAIPFDVFNFGITWDWEIFPERPRRRKRRCSRAAGPRLMTRVFHHGSSSLAEGESSSVDGPSQLVETRAVRRSD